MPPSQMNFGPKQSYPTASYKTAEAQRSQSNYQGDRVTKKRGDFATGQQTNNDVRASVTMKSDEGQGQKSGTGCNDGF